PRSGTSAAWIKETPQLPVPVLRRNWPAAVGALLVPVPPFAIGTVPDNEILGFCPPLLEMTPVPPTESTPLFEITFCALMSIPVPAAKVTPTLAGTLFSLVQSTGLLLSLKIPGVLRRAARSASRVFHTVPSYWRKTLEVVLK